VTLRPLRERRADIVPLARRFLERFRSEHGVPALSLSSDAEARLTAYRWPGNVGELVEVIRRAAARRRQGAIGADDLGLPSV
jgi:DNA-binding NtrC family response regulator